MNDEISVFKSIYVWLIIVAFIVSGAAWFFRTSTQAVETGIVRYQEFQEIYNTTKQTEQNICNLSFLKEDDKMFKDFSKPQQILALKSNLNRWIAEYNAKSNLINFNIWKSKDLPYQLNINQYNCL